MLEATQIRRLVVGDEAIEVDNDRTDHGVASPGRSVN